MTKNKVEIVAPAGNFEKLKSAVAFGADSVFFGGESFNLRNKSDNFSFDDISEAVNYCNSHGVKPIFLLNSFMHEHDIPAARELIKSLKDIKLHAVVVSDPGMMELVRDEIPELRIHISTQLSTLNHLSIRFWEKLGVSRIVLAREVTVDEIKSIRENTSAELEVFAHGALCISYSGRCLLSRYMTGLDANRGSCTHPCRWKYKLIEEKRPGEEYEIIEHEGGTEILSSKDLCIIGRIGEYIDAGVNAFKIEGRMKSIYYAANTVRIYKAAAELFGREGSISSKLDFFKNELDLISHRPFTENLFSEFEQKFENLPYIKRSDFMAVMTGRENAKDILIHAYNPIRPGDILEAIFPIKDGKIIDGYYTVNEIIDTKDNNISYEIARPNSVYKIRLDREISDDAVFRKRLKE